MGSRVVTVDRMSPTSPRSPRYVAPMCFAFVRSGPSSPRRPENSENGKSVPEEQEKVGVLMAASPSPVADGARHPTAFGLSWLEPLLAAEGTRRALQLRGEPPANGVAPRRGPFASEDRDLVCQRRSSPRAGEGAVRGAMDYRAGDRGSARALGGFGGRRRSPGRR